MRDRPRSRPDPGLRAPLADRPGIRVLVVAPRTEVGLDRLPASSDNPAMDPLIVALAQLVRDRYERELASKAARRGRLRVLEGKPA